MKSSWPIVEGKTLQNNNILSSQPSHMSEELDRDFLLTETLKNLVGQHAINLKHFSRVTLVSNKIEKLFEIEELNRDFLLNTSN